MSFTPWSTVVVGQVATAAWANSQIGDNLTYLGGNAGEIVLAAGALRVKHSSGFADGVEIGTLSPAGNAIVALGAGTRPAGGINQVENAVAIRGWALVISGDDLVLAVAPDANVGTVWAPTDPANERARISQAGGLVSKGLRVQRRGDGQLGHMESGSHAFAGAGAFAVTFVDAFSTTPNVGIGSTNAQSTYSAKSATGVTLNAVGACTIDWIADGVD